jgi:hypothetical protein
MQNQDEAWMTRREVAANYTSVIQLVDSFVRSRDPDGALLRSARDLEAARSTYTPTPDCGQRRRAGGSRFEGAQSLCAR